jgi:hypothetical protein
MKAPLLDEVKALLASPETLYGAQRAEEIFYDRSTTNGMRRQLGLLIEESVAKIGIKTIAQACRSEAEYAHRLMRHHSRFDPIE